MRCLGLLLEACQSPLGFSRSLCALSHAPAQGQRIALDDLMHEVKQIRHTQALQALFGELNERLGPVTDQVQHLGSQGLEPLSTSAFQVA